MNVSLPDETATVEEETVLAEEMERVANAHAVTGDPPPPPANVTEMAPKHRKTAEKKAKARKKRGKQTNDKGLSKVVKVKPGTPDTLPLSDKMKKRVLDALNKDKEKKAKAVIVGPLCLCGCGVNTRGGRYCPGHDAKHHSALKKAAIAAAEAKEKAAVKKPAVSPKTPKKAATHKSQ